MTTLQTLQVFQELTYFLKEMAQQVPYEQRRFKGSMARQMEAERLLVQLLDLAPVIINARYEP